MDAVTRAEAALRQESACGQTRRGGADRVRIPAMRYGRFAPVALACALLLGAAACTGSSGDGPSSPPPSSRSPTTSVPTTPPSTPSSTTPAPSTSVPTTGPNVRPGEKPPVLAPIGRTNTPQGAVAFARYWMAALDWGYATTSSVAFRASFSRVCTRCDRLASIIDRARSAGNHFEGGRITLTAWSLAPAGADNGASKAVDVTFSQQRVRELDSAGGVIATDSGLSNVVRRVWLRWDHGRWTAVDTKQVIRR